jgi:DNA mismatch repair protein MutL
MGKILVLDELTTCKIAAGEVVERPASVVKEMAENAIDAGATKISVEIKNGGIKYISIRDNGKGIPADELESAFLRHATSKLRCIEDLNQIGTMGFRGEALSSICAVSEVQVVSRTKNSDVGMCMSIRHGVPSAKEEVACNCGTTMVVENLFANVPARMKFLKKDSTEASYVTDVLGRIALANPEIAFRYICDGKEVFSTSGDGKLKNAILNIYDIDHARSVFEVDYTEHGITISGVVGKAELARGNRTRQTLFVNGRYIKNHVVAKVVEEAYRNVLMTGKFPFFVLNIALSPELVDVNVHPAKTEIKFANEKEVYNIVHCAVKNALYSPATDKDENVVLKQMISQKTQTKSDSSGDKTVDRQIVKDFMDRAIPKSCVAEPMTSKAQPTTFKESVQNFVPELNKGTDQAAKTFETKLRLSDVSGQMINKSLDIAPPTMSTKKQEDITPKQLEFNFETTPEIKEPAVKIVGQVFDTYVVAEMGDEMLMIDQHAAHERTRFESLKKDYLEKKTAGQILLSPIVLDASGEELQAIKDNSQLLSDMGFSMEEFGKGSVIIRETPYPGDEEQIKTLAEEVLSALVENRPMGLLSFEERILDMISCKYAIKANRRLSLPEMEEVVKSVLQLEKQGITTCPHGRPIKLSYSKKEIEKGFKRIV